MTGQEFGLLGEAKMKIGAKKLALAMLAVSVKH
jgi:hypothetical protein